MPVAAIDDGAVVAASSVAVKSAAGGDAGPSVPCSCSHSNAAARGGGDEAFAAAEPVEPAGLAETAEPAAGESAAAEVSRFEASAESRSGPSVA